MSSPLPAYNSMVASATVLPAQRRLTPQYASWQEQAWGFYDQLGEFESAVSWRANTMSRVRLLAAKLAPGGDEPEPVDSGPAAEAVGRLAGGTGGQSQLMAELTAHLTVVGETWVVGEDDPDNDTELWSVRSADELRVQSGPAGSWQLRDDPRATAWRTPSNVMVVRVWDPHPRRGWEADPAARHAFSAMTKLDLANKRIIATLISRLASNGILLYDKERLSIQTTPQTPAAGPVGAPDALGGGEPDPFAAMLVDVASRGIKDPTSPEAVIPIPLGYSLPDLANVDPSVLLQHITFASDVDEKLLAQRQDALRELATALDMPVEALLGVGDLNHWCMDVDTSILVRGKGWVGQDELTAGDLVMSLDHTTGVAQWEPVIDIYRAHVTDEPMLEMESANHSSLSTAAHRWPIIKTSPKVSGDRRRWTTSAQGFAAADRVPVAAPCNSLPDQPKYADDFVRLAAAYTSDGTVLRYRRWGSRWVRIVKFDPWEIAELGRVLTSLFGPTGWSRQHHPTRDRDGTAFCLGVDASQTLLDISGHHKALSMEFVDSLTLAQLELLLSSMVTLGDGVIHGNATMLLQVEPVRLAPLAYAAILAGYRVTEGQRKQQTGYGNRPLHWIRFSRSRTTMAPFYCRPRWTSYSGIVWCPTTPSGTWLARRNGSMFFTGNSAWAVEESGIKIHVAPPAELICHALTVGYLKPYLEAAGEDPKGLIVWYDPSELTLRPDRSANTLQAYDKLEASGPALRREFGLSEDDKPDEAELRSMILKKQAGMESLSATALAELTGTTEAVAPVPGGQTPTEEPAAGGQPGPPGTLDQPPPDGGQQAPPDRAALAAMDPAALATLADDVAAVLAAVSPGSRWVDPLTPVRHANSH